MDGEVTLKARGLNKSPNQLSLPPGSLTEGENVVIRRDDVIEPVRGHKLYGNSFGTSGDRAKQLLVYKERVLRHYESTIQYDNGTENFEGEKQFDSFNGTYAEVESGLRIKGIEANGNFYFTTASGIKKISATDADEFTTDASYITNAGGIKALDLSVRLDITPGSLTGFLSQDSKVAYRILWNIKDVNNYLVPGVPSERYEVSNSLLTLMIYDFGRLLKALDDISVQTGSKVNDNDYVSTLLLSNTASAAELRTNLISLAEKLDKEQGTLFSTSDIDTASISSGVCTVNLVAAANYGTFGKISVGDKVYLSGFTPATSGTLNGVQTITAVTATSFSFSTSATGSVNLSSEGVESGWFRSITEPSAPSAVVTNSELEDIQDYFDDIITELQSSRNVKRVADNNGSADDDPVEIDDSTTSSEVVTINIDTNDPRDNLVNGDYVVLGGTWEDDESTDFSGLQQVDTVGASSFTLEVISGLSDGTNTVDTDSTIDRVLRFTTAVQTTYLSDFVLTTTTNTVVTFTVPPEATTSHYYQIYRSTVLSASGTTVLSDLTPSDEMQLVYEDYPTSAEITAGTISVEDVTLDVFRGANLYTNSISGEGLLQANDVPPLSKDIAIWKNYVFYANTKTRQRLNLSLLGVSFLIEEATAGRTPKFIIATEDTENVYTFVLGKKEITEITTVAGSSLAASGTASYFTINNANDNTSYYVWYKIGTATDPAVANKTGIMVLANAGDTDAQIATKTKNVLSTYVLDFTTSVNSNVVTVTNVDVGYTTNAAAGTSGFTINVTQQGIGENATNKEILLSENASAGQAVDITARSMVKMINQNGSEVVSAFYLSGSDDVPGKMLLEGQNLGTAKFYVLADTAETGSTQMGESFSPLLTPTNNISNISVANPTVITSNSHGLVTNDKIIIINSDSTPSIDGIHTITRLTANTFSINVNVSNSGSQGAWTKLTDTLNIVASDNEIQPNRIYYSKVSQPEAVPLLNYIDLGPKDKEILRILPLRDALLVFKEDGLYRISGDVAPFVNELDDPSVLLLAPDSLSLFSGSAVGWMKQGITMVSDSGPTVISRPIDTDVFKRTTYDNFSTITWGIGYESDNTYRVWTVEEDGDTVANIAFMFCDLTNSWTTINKSATCGVITTEEDKLYLGAGDTNYIEQERKNFDRTDYAGREYTKTIGNGAWFNSGLSIRLSDVDDVEVGDVLVQNQPVSIYTFNQLLKKLDDDIGIGDSDYESLLTISEGDDIREAMETLATKLDADALQLSDYADDIGEKTGDILGIAVNGSTSIITTDGAHDLVTGRVVVLSGTDSTPNVNGTFVVTVLSSTTFSINKEISIAGTTGTYTTTETEFSDIRACYNRIISKLNTDTTVAFNNYESVSEDTTQECIITAIDENANVVTVNIALPFIQGDVTIYKSISTIVTYSPIVFGDPLSWKHLRQATLMFEDKTFTSATVSFATDLLPAFVSTSISGLGNGIFGHSEFGEGFFGGQGNSTPSRTWIPRNCARCRYLVLKFEHSTAREKWSLFGITVVGNMQLSERAYRK